MYNSESSRFVGREFFCHFYAIFLFSFLTTNRQIHILKDSEIYFYYIYMAKTLNSGLGLALKLISVSLHNDSENNKTIRTGVIKLLEKKMHEVVSIDAEEVPALRKQLSGISAKEPRVAEEVEQLIKKFHPNL